MGKEAGETGGAKRGRALEALRQALQQGRYEVGGAIPSEHELRAQLKIGRNTIREAVSVLVQEGWLERIQGRGTLVRGIPPATRVRTCLVMGRTSGDIYEQQAHGLLMGLEERGVMPMVASVHQRHDQIGHARACLDFALAQSVDGIIMDCPSAWMLERCAQAGDRCPPVAAINAVDPTTSLPMHRVLADFRRGAFLATDHLRRLGHERILCVIHRHVSLQPEQPIESIRGLYGDLIHGYLDGLGGLPPQYLLLRREFMAAEEIRDLQTMLRSRRRPTAVFATADYRAKVMIDVARRLGLKIPDDLAVVGFHNTPWATLMEPPLSSVCLDTDTIAELAVERLFGAGRSAAGLDSTTVVPPELIVRDSCGLAASQAPRRQSSVNP